MTRPKTTKAPSYWADQNKVDRCVRLWLDGKSASEIAQLLGGGITRNAVISKVHRLGLTPRHKDLARHVARRAPPRPRRPRVRMEPPPLNPEPYVPLPDLVPAKPVSHANLKDHHCRWIYGDPSSNSTHCGEPVVNGTSWCKHHLAIVFDTPPVKQKQITLEKTKEETTV